MQIVSTLLLQAAVAGFVGARAPSMLTNGGHLLSSSGYWFQAGMMASAITIMFSPHSTFGVSGKLTLLSAAFVSLPLGEAIGRLGCHFAGCCGSTFNATPKASTEGCQVGAHKRVSAPLLASSLALLIYIGVVSQCLQGLLGASQAAALSTMLQGLVRLCMELYRDDVPRIKGIGIKPTVAFALAEVLVGLAYVPCTMSFEDIIGMHWPQLIITAFRLTKWCSVPVIPSELTRTLLELPFETLLTIASPIILLRIGQSCFDIDTKPAVVPTSVPTTSFPSSARHVQAYSDTDTGPNKSCAIPEDHAPVHETPILASPLSFMER